MVNLSTEDRKKLHLKRTQLKINANMFLVLVLALSLSGVHAFGPAAFAANNRHPSTASTACRDPMQADEASLTSRRSWISGAGLATSALLTQVALPEIAAAAEKLEVYEDPNLNFQIKVPSNWEKQVQTLPDRRKIILFIDPTSDKDKSLLFFASTPVRDDFTSLSSFGSVDQVAEMTIRPKGELAGEGSSSKMIKAESKKNAYFFDYEAKTPGQPLTHFRTIFSLVTKPGSAGANLVTLTAQTPESTYAELKPLFDEIMDSYGKVN